MPLQTKIVTRHVIQSSKLGINKPYLFVGTIFTFELDLSPNLVECIKSSKGSFLIT